MQMRSFVIKKSRTTLCAVIGSSHSNSTWDLINFFVLISKRDSFEWGACAGSSWLAADESYANEVYANDLLSQSVYEVTVQLLCVQLVMTWFWWKPLPPPHPTHTPTLSLPPTLWLNMQMSRARPLLFSLQRRNSTAPIRIIIEKMGWIILRTHLHKRSRDLGRDSHFDLSIYMVIISLNWVNGPFIG